MQFFLQTWGCGALRRWWQWIGGPRQGYTPCSFSDYALILWILILIAFLDSFELLWQLWNCCYVYLTKIPIFFGCMIKLGLNTNLLFTGESDLNDNLSFLTAENIFQFRTARMNRGMMPLKNPWKLDPFYCLFLCTCEQIPCPKLIVDYVVLVQSQSSQRVIVAEKFQSFTFSYIIVLYFTNCYGY